MLRYIVVFVFVFMPFSIHANEGDLVFIDLQKVIDNSTAANNAESDIQSRLDKFQTKLIDKRASFQIKSDNLKNRASVLSEEVFEQEKQLLISELGEEEEVLVKKSKKLEHMFNLAQNIIRKNVDGIVADLAKENNYFAVIPKSQTIYSLAKYEITDEVIELLNKKLPKIDFENK